MGVGVEGVIFAFFSPFEHRYMGQIILLCNSV